MNKSYDHEKGWPSINHSILSVLSLPCVGTPCMWYDGPFNTQETK
jgi:hypothetical protein